MKIEEAVGIIQRDLNSLREEILRLKTRLDTEKADLDKELDDIKTEYESE